MILASASPRRRQLLTEAGYEFDVVPCDIDESSFSTEDLTPRRLAERLALVKAKNVAGRYPSCLVVGADTVVDFDGRLIGKPADAAEAEAIIRKLFSKPHKVITAVALVSKSDGVEIVDSDSTTVYPRKMTDEQIAAHIAGGAWRDKAGAYAIKEQPQGPGGDEFVERIDGSLTNVMGLPMELLSRLLASICD